jgi:hypothetical protein
LNYLPHQKKFTYASGNVNNYLIPQKTLHRYVVKAKSNNAEVNLERVGYYIERQIFSS